MGARDAVEPLLALDLGNSRLKGCLFTAGGDALGESWILASGTELTRDLGILLEGLTPVPARVALASVAEPDLERAVARAVEDRLAVTPRLNPPCGLPLEVETPDTTGRDRLYAARGALARLGEEAIVVDAGTALTVDAVRDGVFLGGAIAPGPVLLAEALARGGARLPEIDPHPGADPLGRSTHLALAAGVAVGFEGAALRLVEGVARGAGLASGAPIALTGGARAWIEPALGELPRPLTVDPLLVLRGLAAACSP